MTELPVAAVILGRTNPLLDNSAAFQDLNGIALRTGGKEGRLLAKELRVFHACSKPEVMSLTTAAGCCFR